MSIVFDIPDGETLRAVMDSPYKLLVIDVYADWCQPCKILGPILEQLAQKYADHTDLLFCKMNNKEGIRRDLRGYPTVEFWVTKDDKKVLFHTITGLNEPEIKETIDRMLNIGAPKKATIFDSPYKTYSHYS